MNVAADKKKKRSNSQERTRVIGLQLSLFLNNLAVKLLLYTEEYGFGRL
jgi:hypothetical protein